MTKAMGAVVYVEGLQKSYGATVAVAGISFEVQEGDGMWLAPQDRVRIF